MVCSFLFNEKINYRYEYIFKVVKENVKINGKECMRGFVLIL